MITVTHLGVCSSVSALVRELHHSRDHAQRQPDGKSEEEPTQSLGLQRAPAVSAPVEATGLPPLVTEVVEITGLTQFEDSNGELLSPWGCWQEREREEDRRSQPLEPRATGQVGWVLLPSFEVVAGQID